MIRIPPRHASTHEPTREGRDNRRGQLTRIPAQRDTLYRHLRVHWTPQDDPTDERVTSHFSSIVNVAA